MAMEKGKREDYTRESTKRTVTQSLCLGKSVRLTFMSSCNQWCLKPRVLNVDRLGWNRALRTLPCSQTQSKKKKKKQVKTAKKQPFKECLRHTGGEYLLFMEQVPQS